MSYDDPEVRPLLDLEGLKAWRPGAPSGYAPLERGGRRVALLRRPTATSPRPAIDRDGCGLTSRRSTSCSTLGDLGARRGRRASWCAPAPAPGLAGDVRVVGTSPDLAIAPASVVPEPGGTRSSSEAGAVAPSRAGAPADRWVEQRARGAARRTGAVGDASTVVLGARGARRARSRRAAPTFRVRASTSKAEVWADERRAPLRAGRGRRSGTRRPRSTGTTPFELDARRRGRRRAGHDVPDRERERGPGRAGPLPRPGAPALPRGRRSCSPIQVADEARHVEVFTRRAAAARAPSSGLSTVGGQASLQTLLDEPDFAIAHFLLSVLGEGTFLSLLSFLETHAPDPVTRQVAHLALAGRGPPRRLRAWPTWAACAGRRPRPAGPAGGRRRAAPRRARPHRRAQRGGVRRPGAAGGRMRGNPAAISRGFAAVQALQDEMAAGRRRRW